MDNNIQPRKKSQLSVGQKLVGYIVMIAVAFMLYYFFKSGAWTFFAPVR